MSIAPNKAALKGRLDRYFWESNDEAVVRLRSLLYQNFGDFERVAVLGGLVRDFAFFGRAGFKSDVDLVIDAPSDIVQSVAKRMNSSPNRFGGFGFTSQGWKIDFWALETTWARKCRAVDSVEDVIASTFFDWDSAAYDLWSRLLIVEDDYLDKLRSGVLDVRLLENPSPLGNLVRAVRRCVLWDVRMGRGLRDFVSTNLDDDALMAVQRVECEVFETRVSTGWRSSAEAKKFLLR